MLDVRVKRGAELSTDHHLFVCNLRLEKPTGPTQTYRTRMSFTNRVGDPGKQGCQKGLCRQRIFLVPRAPGMYSGCVWVAAVASFTARVYGRKQIGLANK